MIESIRTDKMFYTSAGNQIREYHHADDLAKIIVRLVTASELGIHQINSGVSIRQNTLSKAIFSQFGKMNLLQIDPLDSPAGENYNFFWPRHSFVQEDNFRNPIGGIIQMIAKQM
jgi:nucleoside-diphosphate-sugar epimerase